MGEKKVPRILEDIGIWVQVQDLGPSQGPSQGPGQGPDPSNYLLL